MSLFDVFTKRSEPSDHGALRQVSDSELLAWSTTLAEDPWAEAELADLPAPRPIRRRPLVAADRP